jgi:hypothetical protein
MPGFTMLPNSLVDALLPQITPITWKVLAVIVRETIGRFDHGTQDRRAEFETTVSSLARRIGHHRETVGTALDLLAVKEVVRLVYLEGEGVRIAYTGPGLDLSENPTPGNLSELPATPVGNSDTPPSGIPTPPVGNSDSVKQRGRKLRKETLTPSEAVELAALLLDRIRENEATTGGKFANMTPEAVKATEDRWADEFARMMRQTTGHGPIPAADLRRAILAAQADNIPRGAGRFCWSSVVKSPAKVLEHLGRLLAFGTAGTNGAPNLRRLATPPRIGGK